MFIVIENQISCIFMQKFRMKIWFSFSVSEIRWKYFYALFIELGEIFMWAKKAIFWFCIIRALENCDSSAES